MVGLSVGEKLFIQGGIAQDLRTDGRKRLTYRPIFVQTGVIAQANGSAKVKIGKTEVIASVKVEYWLHDQLEMEKGKHSNMMHHNNLNKDFGSNDANFPSISEAYPAVEKLEPPLETHPTVERAVETRPLCEDCMQADKKGVKPEFHLCVYDEVVEGFFKSPAGPICRPMRK